MSKLIHAQVFTDGLSRQARNALQAAVEYAFADACRRSHRLSLHEFCRLAYLPVRLSKRSLAKIVEEANCAQVRCEGIDVERLDDEPHDLGTYRPFQSTKVTDTSVEFEVCPALLDKRVFFSGFWQGADQRLN